MCHGSDLSKLDFSVDQFGQHLKPSLTLRGWGRDCRTKGTGSAVPHTACALEGFSRRGTLFETHGAKSSLSAAAFAADDCKDVPEVTSGAKALSIESGMWHG